MAVLAKQIENAIKHYCDPYYPEKDLISRKAVKALKVDGGNVAVRIALGYPAAGVQAQIKSGIEEQIKSVPGVDCVDIELEWGIVANKTQPGIDRVPNIKNVIAVASGKGGVGKSTTSVNLALALAKEGARVGLLDADIYGPSQPVMLGIPADQRPENRDGKYFIPIMAHGLQTMSMGYLVTEKTAMVWRGPMVSGALQQMFSQTAWDNLDYLVVDMPPGTGDIQLTLAQKIPVTGAVIVTTPQDIALLDAQKGIEMFRKVDIEVMGVVENMALHVCSQCGHKEHLFGSGGGERIAQDYATQLLGSLPLDIEIRKQVDGGNPTVSVDPEGDTSQIYREMARMLAANIAKRGKSAAPDVIAVSAM